MSREYISCEAWDKLYEDHEILLAKNAELLSERDNYKKSILQALRKMGIDWEYLQYASSPSIKPAYARCRKDLNNFLATLKPEESPNKAKE